MFSFIYISLQALMYEMIMNCHYVGLIPILLTVYIHIHIGMFLLTQGFSTTCVHNDFEISILTEKRDHFNIFTEYSCIT